MGIITPGEAKNKIFRYCAYQERAHQEVRDKLYAYGLHRDDVEALITTLIVDGFLNEERFARAFAGGKFRIKKWGRIKIVNALELKGVSKGCIKLGLKEIDDESYIQSLRDILQKKSETLDEPNAFTRRDKLAGYAIQKGYESDLVWKEIKDSF